MRTYYCSYCCLWSQRDFCNRLERSRTWEPFILLSFPGWEFISSRIVTSGFVGMGKSIWGRNGGYFFVLYQGVWGVGQSWKLRCSLNLSHHRCIYVSILVQITSMLLKQIWSFPLTHCDVHFNMLHAVTCECRNWASPRWNLSKVLTLNTASSQDRTRTGETRNPWNARREAVSPCSLSSQILLHCHVNIVCLEGNVCTTLSFPVVHPCRDVRQ